MLTASTSSAESLQWASSWAFDTSPGSRWTLVLSGPMRSALTILLAVMQTLFGKQADLRSY
jgi:hypothetical protein